MPNTNIRRKNVHIDVNVKDIHVVVDAFPEKKEKVRISIFEAIKEVDLDKVLAYVNAGGDVNVKNNRDQTPIMVAIKEGWDAKDIKMFLDQTENVDLTMRNGKIFGINDGSPIEMAIKQGDPDLLKVLAEYNGGIKLGKDIIFDHSHNVPNFPATKAVLAEYLDYSALKNYKYGSTFHQFHEADVLYSTKDLPENEFQAAFKNFQEYDLSPAARQLGFSIACSRYGYESEEVAQLIENKFFTDFSGYLLNPNFDGTYNQGLNAGHNEKYLRFYFNQLDDIDGFIDDFKKINNQKDFRAGMDILDLLYEVRAEKLGPLLDDSGTIYINDVIDTDADKINFGNNNVHVDVTNCSNNGQCVHVSVDTYQQLPMPTIIDGIVVA